jgi:uncharacterized protein (PEP-CTERM system associated)
MVVGFALTNLAQGQDVGGAPAGSRVQPRLSVDQTLTDNLRLSTANKDAAMVTTIAPGVSLSSRSGALRGSLDYTLNGIAYLKSDQSSALQNALTANGLAELIDNRAFVDLHASIGQQTASAFGTQSATPALVNANQHEVFTLALSPYVRGELVKQINYELRGNFNRTDTRGSSLGDGRGRGGSLRISNATQGSLGWSLQASSTQSSFASANSNRDSSVSAGLSYRPDPEWSVGTTVGRERSDYLGNGSTNGSNYGVNSDWTPTPRTRLAADWLHHGYGNSHTLSVEHRMAHSVWRLVDAQSLNLGNAGAGGGVRTNYDQFYLLFASVEPDPVKRDVLVRSYLQSLGLSPDAPIAAGFLSAGPSRLRNQQLSVTLQGLRGSVTAIVNRSVTGRLGSNAGVGDLAASASVEQRSYSVSAGHSLTPSSSLALVVSRQETLGDHGGQSSKLTSYSLNWSTRLGPRLMAQLGTRHSNFEAATPYTENAVYANLTQQF